MPATPEWCRMMARYNGWQNDGLRGIVAGQPDEALRRDGGAFFGGVLATLNHILWADRVWLARIAGASHGLGGIEDSVGLTPSGPAWSAGRGVTDRDIAAWAAALTETDLDADMSWTPASGGPPRTRPVGVVAAHLFNHQTHHRGQVHALLTAQGLRPPATDLIAMPA